MVAQRPAVVIIARHGPRLDAADQAWHLSTPTPYDPPLTYTGWNQSKALGVKIASLLRAREKTLSDEDVSLGSGGKGVLTRDFAAGTGKRKKSSGDVDEGAKSRQKKKQKVVIHSSPFLRCVQTSVGIAAGMAQHQPPSGPSAGHNKPTAVRTPGSLHSASPRLRSSDGLASPTLAPIPEPKQDLTHELARRVLEQKPHYRKAKLRVDAFLGEWLNPQYFDQITPPPPSSMMVATAKAELVSNEQVDTYTPNMQPSSRGSTSSLWAGAGGAGKLQRVPSKDGSVDDMAALSDALPASPRRDRRSSVSSVGSSDSSSGRRSPLLSRNHAVQSLPTIVGPEMTTYQAPVPQYAISGSDHIPRGYVDHARQACTNVDYQWDSSRAPQSWGDGGELGEEWSAMHKRFRRGLNHLVQWYSQHDADDRAEDSLSLDQAHPDDEEQEDLIMVLVTHGAGSNALIGALTNQPVLLDIGMASLTMAVLKDDAPPMTNEQIELEPIDGRNRRSSVDMGLSAVYDMKLVSSSEHLRPGVDPARPPPPTPTAHHSGHLRDTAPKGREHLDYTDAFYSLDTRHHGSNSSLGSIRRPSLGRPSISQIGVPVAKHTYTPPTQASTLSLPTPPFTPGLWTPPVFHAGPAKEAETLFERLNETDPSGRVSPGHDLVLDFSNSPPDSRPTSSRGAKIDTAATYWSSSDAAIAPPTPKALAQALSGNLDGGADRPPQLERKDSVEFPRPESKNVPQALSRGLSQKGLWGSKPAGDRPKRKARSEPKRRWTLLQE